MSKKESTFKCILNNFSLHTLEEISSVSLAIQLTEEEEIRNIYCQHFLAENVENKMSPSMVSKLTSVCKSLQLPDALQAKLVSAFHWIKEQYFNYINFVVRNLPLVKNAFPQKIDYITHIMNSVNWSMMVIDKEKSMHQLFLLQNIKEYVSLDDMFKMGSKFCFEDDLKILWEEMSDAEKSKLVVYCKRWDFITLYWICKMIGDMSVFMKSVPDFLNENQHFKEVIDFEEPHNYAFVLYIFKGDISGVKYFKKLSKVDIEHMVPLIKIFLKELNRNGSLNDCHGQRLDAYADKLYFLLKEIEDEEILKNIFHEFYEVFLKISIKYWPWHKFFFPLLKMFVDIIHQVLFNDLITQLSEDVKMEKYDSSSVKMILKNVPNELKKSFCLFISHKQKDVDVGCLWEQMTIEIFNMFLKDEELRSILTPYENYGISELILRGRYDLIEFWLKKCLVSEEAIISYFEHFIQTKTIEVFESLQGYPLGRVNQYLNWVFKHENFMSRDKILKVINEAIDKNIIRMFVTGLKSRNWEDLKNFMDWLERIRKHEYENDLFTWKPKAVEEYFRQVPNLSNFNCNFFHNFLRYGVNDFEKIKVMMSKVDVNEVRICTRHLKRDSAMIDSYLKFLKGCGKDIFLLKENVFFYIFNEFNSCNETDFGDKQYWENIRKLLMWNCESDQEIEKVEEIKKAIIIKYAPENTFKCFRSNWLFALINIFNFLFENKMEHDEWVMIVSDLKMIGIEQIKSSRDIWAKEDFYYDMAMLLNWGKENQNYRKIIWDAKKSFIECLKINIQGKVIPKLISDCNFISSFFEEHEFMADFEKILWDLKEFLVNKVINYNDDVSFRQLLENLKGFSDFLNWNSFDKAIIQELKIKTLDKTGADSCTFWIENDKFHHILNFFTWFLAENSHCELKSIIFKLKRDVLDKIVENSEYWEEKNFVLLDKFLLMHATGYEKNLKRIVWEKYGEKNCSKCLIDGNLSGIIAFFNWCISENSHCELKSIILELKKDVIGNVVNYSQYWEEKYFERLDEFLLIHGNGNELDLRNTVFEKYGVENCSKCVIDGNLTGIKAFFNWCINKNSHCDLKSKIQKFKRDALDLILSEYSKDWEEKYFERLDDFLLIHATGTEKDLKKVLFDKYGIKNCSQCLIDGNFYGITAFIKWAEIEDKELIKTFKRNVLIEILNVENVNCWKDKKLKPNQLNCRDALKIFLYEYDSPDPVEIACMKLDLLEVHFFKIFEKLFREKDQDNLNGFLKWSLIDNHMKSPECLFRTEKLKEEMIEKFGCVLINEETLTFDSL